MERNRTALVLGATGGIGGSIAAALARHGWQVRGMARNLATARNAGAARIEWVEGDAMQRADVVRAAQGVSVIVHAVNPPNYMNWEQLVLPMIDNTIAAAREADRARVVLPGTIYNFDPATTPVIHAHAEQRPKSRKGAIRVALEQRMEQAAPDIPALILRAGDFFGPGVRASWFAQAMVAPGKPLRRIINPAPAAVTVGPIFLILPRPSHGLSTYRNACIPSKCFSSRASGMTTAHRWWKRSAGSATAADSRSVAFHGG